MSTIEHQCDVTVAGAGPVGLVVSCLLAEAGVSVVTLDRLLEPSSIVKAGSIGPVGGEVLDRMGLGPRIDAEEQATLARYAEMFTRLGLGPEGPPEHFAGLDKIDPARFGDPNRRRRRVEQPALEAILRRRAAELGVDLRGGHEVLDVEQDEAAVTVTVEGPNGTDRIRSAYVVGCDGRDSVVRAKTNLSFTGTEPTVTGRQAIVRLADPNPVRPGFHFTAKGLLVYGLGVERIAAIEFDGPPTETHPLTSEELQDSIRRVSGLDVEIAELLAGGRFTDTARIVSAYQDGRILLAGDAAHIHAPFGGQGLNVGLADAANLGWKLAAVVNGWAPEGLLATYTGERRPVGEQLLHNTLAQGALMRPDPQSQALRAMFSELMDFDAVNEFLCGILSGVDTRYDLPGDHDLVGTTINDIPLPPVGATADPPSKTLSDVLRPDRAVLVDSTLDPTIERCVRPWADRVAVVHSASVSGAAAVLVRPDGCLAWAADDRGIEAAGLEQALRTWFGSGDPTAR